MLGSWGIEDLIFVVGIWGMCCFFGGDVVVGVVFGIVSS
jgi:hypothetical protein